MRSESLHSKSMFGTKSESEKGYDENYISLFIYSIPDNPLPLLNEFQFPADFIIKENFNG